MRVVLFLLLGLTALPTTGCAPTCEPTGVAYCEGDVLQECVGDDDKGTSQETDCAASGEVCDLNASTSATPAAACRPADCEEGWACFPENLGHRMCSLSGDQVFVCVDEGSGCFGWELVEDCADLGEGLSCVELEDDNSASCL